MWPELRRVLAAYAPYRVALNTDKFIAFGGGLHVGEYEALAEALGEECMERTVNEPMLAVEYVAGRVPGQLGYYRDLQEITWALIEEAFSEKVIAPGITTTEVSLSWQRAYLCETETSSNLCDNRTSSGGTGRRCSSSTSPPGTTRACP